MYGVWNAVQKRFVFGIAEETPGRAQRALFHKIGKGAYKWRYEVRKIRQRVRSLGGHHREDL